MNAALRAICRPELAAGFGLAGVAAIDADSPSEAASRITELLDDPAVGVILIEEGYYGSLPDDLRRRLMRQPLPMVVPFPGIAWAPRPEAAESYIVELLRQVIGYRVRLR